MMRQVQPEPDPGFDTGSDFVFTPVFGFGIKVKILFNHKFKKKNKLAIWRKKNVV